MNMSQAVSFLTRCCSVNVNFNEEETLEEVVFHLNKLNNPQILLWYVGCYGLREFCVNFYKQGLIIPVLRKNPRATFWFLDLTAWNAFTSPKGCITKFSSLCDKIKNFGDCRIRCVKTSELFEDMIKLSDENLVRRLSETFSKDFLKTASKGYPRSNIRVKDVFPKPCPIIKCLYEKDTSEAYSAFQYLEGCLLVLRVVEQFFLHRYEAINSSLDIAFVLPNDEFKYYQDDFQSFQSDLNLLLSTLYELPLKKDIDLSINFFSYLFGSEKRHRPYNAPSKVVSKKCFSIEHIIGEI